MMHPRIAPRLLALAATLLAAAPAVLQAQAVDNVLKGFQRTSDYVLVVDGKDVPAAEVYLAQQVPAYLVITTALPSPTLLSPRSGLAETVPIMKVAKRPDGSVDLLADADLKSQGNFQVVEDQVRFTVEGRKATLKPRPPLLGSHLGGDLKSFSPEYARGAKAYAPDKTAIAALRKVGQPVKVKVFFGSWCPHCKEHVPMLLRVEDELKGSGSKIQFEYYGLPQGPAMAKDPEAVRMGVNSVPTGFVYVNGKQVGRLAGEAWAAPEKALRDMLSGKAQSGR
jgi:thiol-disulfide isomerase/thioredoxin